MKKLYVIALMLICNIGFGQNSNTSAMGKDSTNLVPTNKMSLVPAQTITTTSTNTSSTALTFPGVCGSAAGSVLTQTPTQPYLCSAGTPSVVSFNGSTYSWSCAGTSSTATCNAAARINGSCGTASGGTFSSTPTANLCATGTAGPVSLLGATYSWTCMGNAGSVSNASCSASTASTFSCAPGTSFKIYAIYDGNFGISSAYITSGGITFYLPDKTAYTGYQAASMYNLMAWQLSDSYWNQPGTYDVTPLLSTSTGIADNSIGTDIFYLSSGTWSVNWWGTHKSFYPVCSNGRISDVYMLPQFTGGGGS